MHARNVFMRLKPNAVEEFARTLDTDVLPLLRRHAGFTDELTFIGPDGTEALAISLWEDRASADAYDRDSYPRVLSVMAMLLQDTPVVHTYEVSTSTLHAKRGNGAGGRLLYLDRSIRRVKTAKLGWSGWYT